MAVQEVQGYEVMKNKYQVTFRAVTKPKVVQLKEGEFTVFSCNFSFSEVTMSLL